MGVLDAGKREKIREKKHQEEELRGKDDKTSCKQEMRRSRQKAERQMHKVKVKMESPGKSTDQDQWIEDEPEW